MSALDVDEVLVSRITDALTAKVERFPTESLREVVELVVADTALIVSGALPIEAWEGEPDSLVPLLHRRSHEVTHPDR